MALTFASLTITCAICYGIYYIVTWHLKRRRLYELASKFPGPPALPIVGNAHIFLGNSEHLMKKLVELNELYPSPFRFWIGPHLFLCISDPEHIKEVCVSPKTLGRGEVIEEFGRPLFGEGLLTAPVPKWRVHRRLIQPTFNTKILDSFVEIFAAQSKILSKILEKNTNGEEFEIFGPVSSCALDMICETAMGINVGAQFHKNFQYVEAIQKVIGGFCKRFFHIWLHPDFIFYRSKLGRDNKKYIKCLHNFTDEVIRMKRNELTKSSGQQNAAEDKDDVCENPVTRRKVFLDLFMKMTDDNDTLSDEELRDEVNTILITGTDSSAIAESYVMLMLAYHPEIQEKVYQELYEIFGDLDSEERTVTAEDLTRMKYLERVIKETIRIFPPIPYIMRQMTEDLKIGDEIFPNGCFVATGIINLHRSEKYWPNPFEFDPDRFLPEEVAKRHPYTFIPFSVGPRNCIGSNYAMLSMKTLLSTILRKYIFKKDNIVPIKDIRTKFEMVLKTVDPIKLRIERRSPN